MILAAGTTITIDGTFLTALFGGITLVIGALAAAYIKIRQWQMENREAQETAVAAVTANRLAVEKVHKIVNSRDTNQRKLISDQTATIKGLASQIAALTGKTNGQTLTRVVAKPKAKRKR